MPRIFQESVWETASGLRGDKGLSMKTCSTAADSDPVGDSDQVRTEPMCSMGERGTGDAPPAAAAAAATSAAAAAATAAAALVAKSAANVLDLSHASGCSAKSARCRISTRDMPRAAGSALDASTCSTFSPAYLLPS